MSAEDGCHSVPAASIGVIRPGHTIAAAFSLLWRTLLSGATVAAVTGAIVGTWTWLGDSKPDHVGGLVILIGSMWLLVAVILITGSAVLSLWRWTARQPISIRELLGFAFALLFFITWFSRIEPAHQPLSTRPHLSLWGAADLALIIASTAVIYWTLGRPISRWKLLLRTALVSTVLSAVMYSFAASHEPSRRRTEALLALDSFIQNSRPQRSPMPPTGERRRVLLIGIDGMDWNILSVLVRAGKLPTIHSILRDGQFWESNNLGMQWSPEIWASIYTGVPPGVHGIYGFSEWRFVGISRPVRALPDFGAHRILFLSRLLPKFEWLGLWKEVPVTTQRIQCAPVWTAASNAGVRVGVFDPVPFIAIGEKVNGFFAVRRDRGWVVFGGTPDGGRTVQFHGSEKGTPTVAGILRAESQRSEVAARLFSEQRVDLGIYYTHFLDEVSHYNWDFRLKGSFIGGGPDFQMLDFETLKGSPVAEAYVRADQSVAELIAAFGSPANIVLVSDHGWEYNEYQHYLGPMGIQVMSPSSALGWGGERSVLDVAPSIASLLGLPTDRAGQDSGKPSLPREFIGGSSDSGLTHEQLERLRALGYIGS